MKAIRLVFLLLTFELQAQFPLDTIVVSAAKYEQSILNSDRNVQIITREELAKSPVNNLSDLLDFTLGVDARQRGSFGVQTDLSMRGGTFEQVLVLVNGIRIGDPQTGHHTMNLPVQKEDIERIEILYGGAAYIFGANAFSGAINIITKEHKTESGPRVSLSGGSFNSLEAKVSQSWQGTNNQGKLSLGHQRSDGFRTNTDYRVSNLWLENQSKLGKGKLDVNLGLTDQAFGAQNFYTPNFPHQYEETRTLFSSARYRFEKDNYQSSFNMSWRRHWDEFQLFREDEDFYRYENGLFVWGEDTAGTWYGGHNYHRSDVLAFAQENIWRNRFGRFSLGSEFRYEGVISNVLGEPMDASYPVPNERGVYTRLAGRENLSVAGQQEWNFQALKISTALQLNYNSDFRFGWYPALSASYRLSDFQNLYASANKSFRFPSFTDLYYNLGGARGSKDLQEEESINAEIGYRYFRKQWLFNATLFRRWGSNIIDWTQACADCDILAGNTRVANFSGVELSVRKSWTDHHWGFEFIDLGYSGLWSDQNEDQSFLSVYVFDYLRHKVNLRLSQKLPRLEKLSMQYAASFQDRVGSYGNALGQQIDYEPILLLNLGLHYDLGKGNLFVQARNLLDRNYVDLGNVELPGFWLNGGISWQF